jgi:hypothetical protein
MPEQSGEVTNAVAIAIGECADVKLIDDGILVPFPVDNRCRQLK